MSKIQKCLNYELFFTFAHRTIASLSWGDLRKKLTAYAEVHDNHIKILTSIIKNPSGAQSLMALSGALAGIFVSILGRDVIIMFLANGQKKKLSLYSQINNKKIQKIVSDERKQQAWLSRL